MRTTSSLEAMNSALNRTSPPHRHIFKFIDHIRLHEFGKSLDLLNLEKNDVSEEFQRKRKLDKERKERISHFTNELQKEAISVREFLEAMSIKSVSPGLGKVFAYRVLAL